MPDRADRMDFLLPSIRGQLAARSLDHRVDAFFRTTRTSNCTDQLDQAASYSMFIVWSFGSATEPRRRLAQIGITRPLALVGNHLAHPLNIFPMVLLRFFHNLINVVNHLINHPKHTAVLPGDFCRVPGNAGRCFLSLHDSHNPLNRISSLLNLLLRLETIALNLHLS